MILLMSMIPVFVAALSLLLMFTIPTVIGLGILFILVSLCHKKKIEIDRLTILLSSFLLGNLFLVALLSSYSLNRYIIILILIAGCIAGICLLRAAIKIRIKSAFIDLTLCLMIVSIIILYFWYNNLLLAFSLPYGYYFPYMFTAKLISQGEPLQFNSASYLLILPSLLGLVVNLMGTDVVRLLAAFPLFTLVIYPIIVFGISRVMQIPRPVGAMVALLSPFVISSAMGTLLYFAQRTLLLLIAPLFLLYCIRVRNTIKHTSLLGNTLLVFLIFSFIAIVDPLSRSRLFLAGISIIPMFVYRVSGLLGLLDFFIVFGFSSIHFPESIPYLLGRLFLLAEAFFTTSFRLRSRLYSLVVGLIGVLVLIVTSAPAIGRFDLLDMLSINPSYFNILPLEPYKFHSTLDAWNGWIIYAIGYGNYYLILFLGYLSIALVLWYNKGLKILLLMPGLLLNAILIIHTGEIFRFLDSIGVFYIIALLAALKTANISGKIIVRIKHANKFPRLKVEATLIAFIIFLSFMYNLSYGMGRYKDYIYINQSRYVDSDELFMIRYLDTNYKIERSFTNDYYSGPIVISDPYTMLMLYYSLLVEPCMKERGFITTTGYSPQALQEMSLLKEVFLTKNLTYGLHLLSECTAIKHHNATTVLVIITWRTMEWIKDPSTVFVSSSKRFLSAPQRISEYVTTFSKLNNLSLKYSINESIYIFEMHR